MNDLREAINERMKATNMLARDNVTEEEVSAAVKQITSWLAIDSVQLAIMGGRMVQEAIAAAAPGDAAFDKTTNRAYVECQYFSSTMTAGLAAVRRLSYLISQYENMVKTDKTQLWTGRKEQADGDAEDGG